MYNYLKIFILSILVLLILLIIYTILNVPSSAKTLKIEPIKIAPLEIKIENSVEKKAPPIRPIDILSKLKTASEKSKEAMVLSKEEQSTDIISSLKKKVEEQIIETGLSPKVLIQNKPIKKKVVLKKKTIIKKEAKPKKTSVPRKVLVSLNKKKKVIVQKVIVQKVTKKINQEKEEENILPDSYYFEPIKEVKTVETNTPLAFAKKLGVVSVSTDYETSFTIPKREELAKEGIVNISNASLDTNEIKNLNFVNTLGVIEVSQDFEIISR